MPVHAKDTDVQVRILTYFWKMKNNRNITSSLAALPRQFAALIIVLLAGSTLASCLNNDSGEYDPSEYNDLYVSSVALGTLPRYLHITASDGTDSIAKSSVSASTAYPMTIDHLQNLVYNTDSLPYGVDAEKVVFSTFSIAQGTLALEMLNRKDDTTGEPVDTVYATTDSIDFSKGPRRFKLYGVDGTSRRTYTVDVRIHQQTEDSLTWRQLNMDDWNREERHCGNLAETFTLDSITFTLHGKGIDAAVYNGEPQPDAIETENTDELPDGNLAWIATANGADAHTKQVLLYGTLNRDSLESRIWRRNVDTSGHQNHKWEYLPVTVENKYPAPALHCATLLHYDKGILLVGIDSSGHPAVRYSNDGGRIWRSHDFLLLPDNLKERQTNSLEASVDNDSNLWLLLDGNEVWYGRAHSVAWTDETKIFLRSPRRQE